MGFSGGGPLTKNKFGLDRHVPEKVSRQVRQECGFGCVICGMAIVEYEHIDPPFAEARTHDPDNIALLCASCHDRVTRKIWSKQKVLEARRSPKTFADGFARDAFDFKVPLDLLLGSNRLEEVRCIVRTAAGEEWFYFDPPEAPEAPPRLSAKFFGPDGKPQLEINRNEWTCRTDVWDLKAVGRVIELYGDSHKLVLRLESVTRHALALRYLDMKFKKTGILVDDSGKAVITVGATRIEMRTNTISHADSVFTVPM
jgi:hypothetical protein